MRIMSVLILAGLLALAVTSPWGEPATVSGQPATPTVTPPPSATPAPTATVPPGSTATATSAATGTVTTGSPPVVTSIAPTSVDSTNSSTISVSGTGFMPGAVIQIEGRSLPTTVVSPTLLTGVVPAGLPPGPYAITVVNPGMPPSPPLAGQFNVTALASTLFVPVAIKRSSDDSTAMFIQNISPGPTSVNVQFYDLNGFSDPSWSRTTQLGAGESAVFDLSVMPNLPPGFDGSAVVQSAQPIAGVVNRTIFTGSTDLGSGDVQAAQAARSSAGSFSLMAGPGAPQESVPVAFGGYHGYFTTISVQNTGHAPGNYTITLFPTGVTTPISTIPRVIPPLASARIHLGPEVGVPPDFVGTAVVAGAGSPMQVAAETIQMDTGVLLSYAGFAGGTNVMNAPLLFKNYNGWVSGAQVVNVASSPVTVTASIFPRDANVSFNLALRTRAPNESFTYYLPAIQELPDGFVGSGVFNANGPISVVVLELKADSGTGMAYSGFNTGTPQISIPVVFKGSNGWDSGVQVQNLGAADATVNITYYLPGGQHAVDAALIAAGSSDTFYQPDNPSIPPNTIGSAIVASVTGAPIVAIVNEVNYTRPGDASMSYEGVNF